MAQRALLAAALALLVLTACGGDGRRDQAGTDPTRATERTTAATVTETTASVVVGQGSGTEGRPSTSPSSASVSSSTMDPDDRTTTSAASDRPDRPPAGPPTVTCDGRDPVDLGYDRFYRQHCDAAGIPVLASDEVDPRAVEAAAEIVVAMIGHRPDIIAEMLDFDLRVGIIGQSEDTTDLPEYRDLYTLYPDTDWNSRARGLGATAAIPLASVAEENVLCRPGDTYQGQSILVHEFAHTIHLLGLNQTNPDFTPKLIAAYLRATTDGRWDNTYAGSNFQEYFATATQSWFDTYQDGPPEGDGIYNDINTRTELAVYDPELHDLVADVFLPDPLPLCRSRDRVSAGRSAGTGPPRAGRRRR